MSELKLRDMLRNFACSGITRALLQPASVRRASCSCLPVPALPRSTPQYTGLHTEPQAGTRPYGVYHKQASPRFRSSGEHKPPAVGDCAHGITLSVKWPLTGTWRCMSKTASAADAADLGQDSEVDRKQTVASTGQCHVHIYIAESLVQQRWLLNSSIYHNSSITGLYF